MFMLTLFFIFVPDLVCAHPTEAQNDTSIPVILPTRPDAPDPLGIALIGGVYGPGTWSAWFINLAVSWKQIGHHGEMDPNTWLFLVGTNWAAVDVVKYTRAINVLDVEDAEYETDFNRYLGRFAAAFSVMFTGIAHTK